MIADRISCSKPCASILWAKNSGTGHPHIICPIEKYISTSKNPSDANSRFFSFGVSWSSKASRAFWFTSAPRPAAPLPLPFTVAPYPASATAFIIALSVASPSTPMEFVKRLTEQDVTPGTAFTAFSTRALQAAQLMPVTLYCFM